MDKINLISFLKNIYNLIKIIFTEEKINWNYLLKRIEDSEISSDAKIFGSCSINKISVGKGTYISMNSSISYTTIGKFCSIGPNFFCGWGIHPINGFSTSPIFYSTKKQVGFTYSKIDKIKEREIIKIGNDVFIGANVTILDGVTIGDGAVIGAGAVVSKDIPPYAVAIGSPIQIKKYRYSEDTIEELLELKWWEQGDDVLEKVEEYFFDIEKFIFYLKDIQNNKKLI